MYNRRVILALGATSLVGVALSRRGDVEVVHCRAPTDLGPGGVRVEDPADMRRLLWERRPSAVLYCHAVCDVGRCQEDPAWAEEVNVGGVENLMRALPPKTRIVYVSSDHIFGGDGCYSEGSTPRPISVYGRTRVLAEERVRQHRDALVVRPGLAVGPSRDGRTGHMDWLRHRSTRGLPITIVADEARSAVWADHLAARLVAWTRDGARGIRHVPASRMVSRPVLARHLMDLQRLRGDFHLTTRAERPFPHLGRVELQSEFADPLSAPLPSVVAG
jgi:dTDP-4-dehydrorhamnose reductase